MTARLAVALLAALLLAGAAVAAPRVIRPDRDDVEIAEDVVLAPGVHRVIDGNGDGVLHVVADGVTVDLGEATLDGAAEGAEADAFAGWGVSVVGARNVTIRGGAVRGFKVAVRAIDAPGLRVVGVDVSGNFRQRLGSTPEREASGDWLWPHENDDIQWETRYGAGISLVDCPGAAVTDCRARRGQNGLLLTRCDGARVAANDFSFLSGWGLAMWRSSRCSVVRNRLDWCVRGYSHGVYDRGQDSTGILVFEQCSDNVFAFNSATHGGDGFFLYAGHETTKTTGRGGCHGNVVYRNDFSHAVANGIEATFSERNLFIENRLDDCNYGVWAGYSRQTVVRGNVMRGCTVAGVAIEHGQDNVIEGNVMERCRAGVSLWWDEDPGLTGGIYGREQDTTSTRATIRGNRLDGCETGVRLVDTTRVRVLENEILRGRVALVLRGDCGGLAFSGNAIHADAEPNVVNETGGTVTLGPDLWLSPAAVRGDAVTLLEAAPVRPRPASWRPLPQEAPFLAAGAARGRERIIVDEWGPYDFATPRLWPARARGGAAATLTLLGADAAFEIVEVTPGLAVRADRDRAPTRLVVTADGDGPSLREGRVIVSIAGTRLEARIALLRADWTVRYFDWTVDPREDAEAWRRLVTGEPLATVVLPSLDLPWGGGRPADGVPADGFATTAEATLRLPAGEYELTTTSDDGVRLIVDGATVIENWTWHGPTEDRTRVALAAGEHRFRVEHFELDGYAVLRLGIRRVGD